MWLAASSFAVPDGVLATLATAQLSGKPHQGVPAKTLASPPGIGECNSTAAIGLRASLALNGLRQSERARYYGSALGRFTLPDWSATPQAVPYANLRNPQSLNLYSYVQNRPLESRDADGHDGCCTTEQIDEVVKGLVDSAEGALESGTDLLLGSAAGAAGLLFFSPSQAGSNQERDWELHHNDPAWIAVHNPQMSKGGKQNKRDTGFIDLTDDEVNAIANDKRDPRRRQAQTEQKARGLRNKQKRGSKPQSAPPPPPPPSDPPPSDPPPPPPPPDKPNPQA